MKKFLQIISTFFIFFFLVAFTITCCMTLFVSTFTKSLGIVLNSEKLHAAAKITFLNVVFLSAVFCAVDTIRRKITVERPVRRITESAEKITRGDFSVRIERDSFGTDENFGRIIDCFNKMAQELDSVETLRTDFIANVSHELKTPLAVMQNFGTMLRAPELSDEKRIEYAKGITDNARRLASLITNILKLNKLENQQIFPVSERYNLGEQLCASLLQFEDIWEEKQIDIETEIEDGVFISSDRELLDLVWNNLLSNAFKFTESGGKVSLILTADKDFATVKIEDTGCGFGEETGQHIFEKFYQGDTSHSTGGNGLGLALVKRVVNIVQGEIGVESKVGEGSAFTVRLKRGERSEP